MGVADNMFSTEEEKYFETKGQSEPTSEPESSEQETGEDIQEREETTREPEPSSEPDGTDAGRDDKEEARTPEENSEPQDADKQKNDGESPKRDFKKAYGIAESKRKELRRQLQEQSQQTASLKQHLDTLMQRLPAQEQTQDAKNMPNKEDDPIGYYNYQLENLNKVVERQQQYLQQQSQQNEYSTRVNKVVNSYKDSAREFAETQPDFVDAYKYLEKSKIQEFMAAGYSQEEAVNFFQEEEFGVALKAIQEDVNPAERVYAAAKARGFNPNMKAPSKLANIQNGIKNSKSLSSTKSKNIKQSLDYDAIDSMTDEEFDRFFTKVKSDQKADNNYHKGW